MCVCVCVCVCVSVCLSVCLSVCDCVFQQYLESYGQAGQSAIGPVGRLGPHKPSVIHSTDATGRPRCPVPGSGKQHRDDDDSKRGLRPGETVSNRQFTGHVSTASPVILLVLIYPYIVMKLSQLLWPFVLVLSAVQASVSVFLAAFFLEFRSKPSASGGAGIAQWLEHRTRD